MMSLDTAGDLWPPASALARISTAHFQHQTSDIKRVTEIHESRPPALQTGPRPSHNTRRKHEADSAFGTRACAHAGQIQRRRRHHLLRLQGSRCVRVVSVQPQPGPTQTRD
jgi:hypothetical protein